MIYKQITLNPWEPPIGEIRVIQEEADGRDLVINLIDDNGSPLDLTGKTVSVYIQKPDNTMIYNSCEVNGNQATVTFTLQMMAASGLTKLCELQIVDTDNHTLKVSLPPLRIVKSDYDGAIESTDEFSTLIEKINEANTAAANANQAAQNANEAAEEAAASAETAAEQKVDDLKGQPNGIAGLDSNGDVTPMPTAADVGAVPTTRTVNGKSLSSNITLTASDVNAVPTSQKGQNNGVATLNGSGKLNTNQFPDANDVGVWSLAGGESIPSNSDLNDYTTAGTYICPSSAVASTLENTPFASGGSGFKLIVQYNQNANWATQFLFVNDIIYLRYYNRSAQSFQDWKTIQSYNNNDDIIISKSMQFSGTQYPQIYGNGTTLQLSWAKNSNVGIVLGSGSLRDAGDGDINLGASSHRFATVFAVTGTINTSDRNAKHDITELDTERSKAFIMGLKPSSYILNNADSGRTHWGMISQDIEELLPKIGMSDMDFAGFIKSPKTEEYYEDVSEIVTDEETGEEKTVTRTELKTRIIEGEYIYALRYDEFIAPLISTVQDQQKQIEYLERRLYALENKEETK